MPVRLMAADVGARVGDTWRAWLRVTDHDGVQATADSVTVDVTLPDDSVDTGTATEQDTTGVYLCTYDLTVAGRHQVAITVTDTDFGNDVVTLTVQVEALTGSLPDLAEVTAYLGDDCTYTAEEIDDALDAETAAQRARCTIPADYPEDLAQALKRRVARNLAARAVPVASFTSFEGGATATRVTRLDAEISRFEAPYLRLITA